jgi:hypothetical protein
MQSTSFKLIQKRHPNEWVLLGNPKTEKGVVLGGIVLYHSPDKKEVCYLGKDKTTGFDRIRLVFTGELRAMRHIGIMKRLEKQ